MEVNTYSASEVIITFGGFILSEWDKVSIRRVFPVFKQVNGIRNKNSRILMSNSSSEVDIELPQTSTANHIFESIVSMDKQYGNGKISLIIKDNLGSELFSTNDGYVEGYASREYGPQISGRSWKILCLSSDHVPISDRFSLESLFSSIN